MAQETKTIEILCCGYASPCQVKGCKAQATVILRGLDRRGHHTVQHEVCTPHSEQAIVREAGRGRQVVRLWALSD